jgi:hypothetical protein
VDVSEGASSGAQLAGLAVEVRHLAMALERVSSDIRELRGDVDGLKTIAAKGSGAYATLAVVGTMAAALAGFVAWGLEHLLGKGGAI